MSAGAFRVVLVEDDDVVRRYVAMALDDMPIDLVVCPDVAQAMVALALPAGLVISDLMMPGESGLVLLERLATRPALRGDARVVVFSAGVNGEMRKQLETLQVWRILTKPAALSALRACVEDAMRPDPPPQATGRPHDSALVETPEDACIRLYFEGDRPLFLAYKGMCQQQFTLDLHAGDTACAQGDLASLHRLAHSLKTVLRSIGHPALADTAYQLEQIAVQGIPAGAAAWALWPPLRAGLAPLAT